MKQTIKAVLAAALVAAFLTAAEPPKAVPPPNMTPLPQVKDVTLPSKPIGDIDSGRYKDKFELIQLKITNMQAQVKTYQESLQKEWAEAESAACKASGLTPCRIDHEKGVAVSEPVAAKSVRESPAVVAAK